MKKVVLLGDSTREGYQEYVKDKLDGIAEVLHPNENCRFALYLLRYVHMWKKEGNWGDDVDLVHWNAGLWDVIHVAGQETTTEPDHYVSVIRRIDKRLRVLFPNAQLVFATSTPGVDSRYDKKDAFRCNREIEMYNMLAVGALWDTDEVIDDLYTAAKGLPDSYFIDPVHYTPEGRALLGETVLSSICPLLGFKKMEDNSWKE